MAEKIPSAPLGALPLWKVKRAGPNLLAKVSMKNRVLALRTGSFGSRELLGKRSATNSIRTRDSAILVDEGDGWSPVVLGPP